MHAAEQFVTTRIARDKLGITQHALRDWADKGLIPSLRTPGGQRLYAVSSFIKDNNQYKGPNTPNNNTHDKICYCRVSSSGQKDDLDRQIEFMRNKYPEHRIISDIGSGINWNRKGLKTILELSMHGAISEVVVTFRDRLCRFAYELIEWILVSNGAKIVVHNQGVDSSPQSELAEDLMSIVHIFNKKNSIDDGVFRPKVEWAVPTAPPGQKRIVIHNPFFS